MLLREPPKNNARIRLSANPNDSPPLLGRGWVEGQGGGLLRLTVLPEFGQMAIPKFGKFGYTSSKKGRNINIPALWIKYKSLHY